LTPSHSIHIGDLWKRLLILTPEALWVFMGQAGTAIAGFMGIKILTHVLSPAEFGKLALANTIIALIGTNIFGPFGQGLMRFWSVSKDRGVLDDFYSLSNRMAKYISLAAFLIMAIFILILSLFRNSEWTMILLLSSIIGIITGLYSLRVGIFTAARQRRKTAVSDITNTLLRPLAAALLVALTVANVNVALMGFLVAALLIYLIVELIYYRTTSKHVESNVKVSLFDGLGKEILSFSWPFIVWGVFGWIHSSCDRWSLQTFYGAEVVGAFAVVSQLAIYPLLFSSGFLSTLFMPIAFQKAGDLTKNGSVISANRILTGMTGAYILGTMLLMGFFVLYHQQLILLISNERFVKYSYLLPGLTTAWGLFFLGQVLTQFGLLANKPQIYIYPKIIASIVAGVSTFYLSLKIGPVGVVWGLGLAGFVYSLWCSMLALKVTRQPVDFQ
jgi:O-antigen/teichoic acid export membrane protein